MKYSIEIDDGEKILIWTKNGIQIVGADVPEQLKSLGIVSAEKYEDECDNCSACRSEYHRGYMDAKELYTKDTRA